MDSGIKLIFSLLIAIILTALLSVPGNVKDVENSNWTLGEEMPTNRTEITAAVLDDKIYEIGGADYRADEAVNTVEIYEPNSNQWTNGVPLPYDLDHAPSVVHNGKIYVIGGFLQDKITTDNVLIYDPIATKWTEDTPLPEPRCCHVAEVVNGTIYAISGLDFDHNPVATNTRII